VGEANLAKGGLRVGEMCQAAVEVSDNTCANLLLKSAGGPAALTAFWRALGDNVTRLDHFELELNRGKPGSAPDTTSPAAMAGTLRRLILGDALSSGSRGRLTDWMIACKTGANRLRGGLPKAWRIADKTGNNGADAAGDIAVVWPTPDRPILISVYVWGGAPKPKQVEEVFAAIGRTIAKELA
jgi:beta-lactamase class A